MRKNKSRNKPNKNSSNINTHKQTAKARGKTSTPTETASSSDAGGFSPFSRRTSGQITAPSTESDAAKPLSHAERRDSLFPDESSISGKRSKWQWNVVSICGWRFRPSKWWPCHVFRETCRLASALVRTTQGPQWIDVLMTACMAVVVMVAGYIAIGLLSTMLKGAAAQETAVDPECSVVYVTVPGPIITISLINASPSNPAKGTYYFSVVNGTTEWMNSIAPPSRFTTLMTRTPEITRTPGLTPFIPSTPTSPTSATSGPNSAPGISAPSPSQPPAGTIPPISGQPPVGTGVPTPPLPSQGGTPSMISNSIGQPIDPSPSLSAFPGTQTPPSAPTLPGLSDSSILGPTQSVGISSLGSLASSGTALVPSASPSSPGITVPESPSMSTPSTPGMSAPVSSSVPLGSFTPSVTGTRTSAASYVPSTMSTRTMSTTVLEPPNSRTDTPIPSLPSTLSASLSSTISNVPTTASTSTFMDTPPHYSDISSAPPLSAPSSAAGISSAPTRGPGSSAVTMSSLQGTLSSVLPSGGQTPLSTSVLPSAISSTVTASSSSTGSMIPSTVAPVVSTSVVQTGSLATTTPTLSRPSSVGSPDIPTSSPATTSTSVQAPSEPTVTVALPSSSSVSGSSPSFPPPSTTSSSLSVSASSPSMPRTTPTTAPISLSSRTSTLSSIVSSGTALPPPSSSALPGTPSSPGPLPTSSITNPVTSSTNSTLSSSPASLPVSGAPSSPALTTSTVPNPVSSSMNSTLSTAMTPGFSSLFSSMSSRNPIASSSAASSSSSVAAGAPTFQTVVPSANASSSSTNQLGSFSLFSSSSSSSVPATAVPRTSSSTMPSGLMNTSPLTTTLATTSSVSSDSALPVEPMNSTNSASSASGSVTRVISFADSSISFVFPTPDITTTTSYWTGTYPTVTGPTPSDLVSAETTTRSTTQTPVSAPPSFNSASSRPRFRTIVTTVYEDEPPASLARRQVIPPALPTVLTTLIPEETTGGPSLSAVQTISPTLVPGGIGTASDLPIVLTSLVPIATSTGPASSAIEAPGPDSCGESGKFTLNFDDTVVPNSEQVLNADGLKNPYHHLFYANGYTDIPDMWEPYPSISQPNVAMFLPLTGRVFANQPFSGSLLPGEIGAGPRASVNAYWFNAYSGYFGCALNGLTACTLRISGYRYDAVLKSEVLVAEQNATLPACLGYVNCRLTQVFFDEGFQALSGIQFNAYTANLNIPQVHMMDDLALEWYNNTCSAGILRVGQW